MWVYSTMSEWLGSVDGEREGEGNKLGLSSSSKVLNSPYSTPQQFAARSHSENPFDYELAALPQMPLVSILILLCSQALILM